MIRIPLLVLFAALFSAPPSARGQQPAPANPGSAPSAVSAIPSVPTALQRCDKPIGEAVTMANKIDDCAKQLLADHAALAATLNAKPSSEPRGLPDTRTSQIPEDVSTPAAKELLLLAAPPPLRPILVDYFSYLSFAAGDPASCKRLSVIGFEGPCRENFAMLNEARAVVSGETWELVKVCRQPENRTPAACCTALAKLKDRASACSIMVPSCFKDAGQCKAFWGRADGDARACVGVPVEMADDCKADGCRARRLEWVARCEAEAAYGRAFKAKDVNQCAGSERCRVLMGQGKEVAAEIAAKKLQNPGGDWFLKGGWKTPPPPPAPEVVAPQPPARKPALDYLGFTCAEPLQSADNRKVAMNVIAAAKTCLTDIENAVGTPSRALTEGMDEREEKLARLTVRMELALAATAAPAKPKPAPAKRPR